jgi:hypothetical protein
MNWAAFYGIDTEESWPYNASDGHVDQCSVNASGRVRAAIKVTGHMALLSRRVRSSPANASGFDTHRD